MGILQTVNFQLKSNTKMAKTISQVLSSGDTILIWLEML